VHGSFELVYDMGLRMTGFCIVGVLIAVKWARTDVNGLATLKKIHLCR
jgi:hypothetical protein